MKRAPKSALPSRRTGWPLGPESELVASIVYAGMPEGPGAALAPNSKTRRSNPGWWATRIAVSCAWLAADPALTRGQAAAGVESGDGATVGTFVADGPALGASVAGTTAGVRETEARRSDLAGRREALPAQ